MYEEKSQIPYINDWIAWKDSENIQSRDKLITAYLPLVQYVVQRYFSHTRNPQDRDDLVGFGHIGLLDAVNRFEYRRGLQFETYAIWRIKGTIIDQLRKQDFFPRSLREKAKRIEEAYAALEKEKLRSADDEEVAKYLSIDRKDLDELIAETSVMTMISLDEPILEDGTETTRLSFLEDIQSISPEEAAHLSFIKPIVAKAIKKLPEKESYVVSLLYFEGLTITEIAVVMSLSVSRISQLHTKALYRLRGALERAKSQFI